MFEFSRLRNTSSLALIALLAGALVATGCDKGGESNGEKAPEGAAGSDNDDEFRAGSKVDQFTFVVSADPETFDTAKMSGAPEGRLAFQLFEGLMVPGPTTEGLDDPADLVLPGVAKSYEVSEDGRTYTFELRKDAKWSNGDPVTSEDFVYSWERVLSPDFPADYATMMYVIKGAKDYNKSEDGDWDEVGVEAPDEHTLVVELENPTPYFPELLAFYTFYPVPKDVVEEHGDDWTEPENIISNGAYKLATYRSQKEITLAKNEHYWGADDVSIDKAKVRIMPDRNAITNAYRSGELHWSGTSLPVSQISSFVAHPDYRRDPMLGNYYFRINVSDEDAPLSDKRVRKALSMATDRQSLVEDVLNGLYETADSYVPPMAGYESTTTVEYNPKRAKALLEEAGYGEGEEMPEISLLYNTDENHKLVAESVQKQWKRNLGIDVELINKEWKMYLQDVDSLNYQVARAGWIGDFNDPMTFLDMWETDNGNNDTGWSNEEYDDLLDQIRSEPDVDKRQKLLQEAETLLLEEGPVIPVYYYTNNVLVSRELEGFEAHNRDIHLLKYMSLPE
ncbi:MAG: peptide ABC transporter substrate-binding protein [Persicimonas sp.]